MTAHVGLLVTNGASGTGYTDAGLPVCHQVQRDWEKAGPGAEAKPPQVPGNKSSRAEQRRWDTLKYIKEDGASHAA